MLSSKNSASGQRIWLISAAAAALIAAALRRWQLSSAFEEATGLAIRGAQASVILMCVLIIAGAWFVLLSMHQRPAQPRKPGQAYPWDLVFLGTGDRVFPMLEIAAAFLAIASVPILFIVGVGQFQLYQEALTAHVQPPTNNGMLTLATAAGAFLAALGLLQMGRDGLRPGRRGRGGFAAALPGVAGCIWLMESFRAHAANPVQWDYAPQLIAIVLGMGFYMDFAGMSAGVARPRRLLWMAGMTVIFSAVSLVSGLAELSARTAMAEPLLCTQLGDVLLLVSQMLAAVGALWRLPPHLESPQKARKNAPEQPALEQEIQEETTDE